MVPNTGLPSFTIGPGFASVVVEEGLDDGSLSLVLDLLLLFRLDRFDRSGVSGFDFGKVGPELHKRAGEPDELAANSRSNSSGVPVTVSGVVRASSPESPSFMRFGITFTLMALSPTSATVNITRPVFEDRQ